MQPDHLFPTRIDIPAENRAELVAQLNMHLATLSDLLTQTKFAHWNVKGPNFIALHKLFDELHEPVEAAVDDVAERVTALGGVALGTARMAADASPLVEFPEGVFASQEVLAALSDRYAEAGRLIREGSDAADELDDANTADLLTGISRQLDKALYFLEAHMDPTEDGEPKAERRAVSSKTKRAAVVAASV